MHIYSYTYIYIHTHMYTVHSVHRHIYTHFFLSLDTKLLQLQIKLGTYSSFTSLLRISALWRTSLVSEVPWFYYPQFESVYISVHRSSFLAFFISIEDIAINETPSHPKTLHSFLAFPHLSCVPCLPLFLFKTTCSLSWEVNCCLPSWALWLEPFSEPWETETIS